MKFCYIDESYDKNKEVIVVVAIMIDSARMNKTKREWDDLRTILSKELKCNLEEIHTTNLYRGINEWKNIQREKRFNIINLIIQYIQERKHKILFSAIDKVKLNQLRNSPDFQQMLNIRELNDKKEINIYRLAALHLALCLQKLNMNSSKNKGDYILIFDQKDNTIIDLIWQPPMWAHQFYLPSKKYKKITSKIPLPQLIDIPYLADSKKVLAINIADFYAYFLCLYSSLKEKRQNPDKSFEELLQVEKWIQQMAISFVEDSNRWVTRAPTPCEKLFYQIAPLSLRNIKKKMTEK